MAQESNYIIEVSNDGSTGWAQLASLAADATSYSHTGLTAGTNKHYRIKAVGNGTNPTDSPYSPVVSATTASSNQLAAPTGFAATNPSAGRVDTSWTDTNTSPNETGFSIEYSTDGGTAWTSWANLAADVVSHSKTGLGNATYDLRIKANGDGSSTADSAWATTQIVLSANNAPTVANPIADQKQTEGYTSFTIDLTNVFADADSDPLTYSAVSSNTALATVSVSGNTLTVTEGTGTGVVNITVTADDGSATVDDVFSVDVQSQALNWSLAFDGVDDAVNMPSDSVLNFANNQAFSVMGWVRPGTNANLEIFNKTSATKKGIEIRTDGSAKLRFILWQDSDLNEFGGKITYTGLTNDAYQHIACVWNGTDINTTDCLIYVNGIVADQTTISGSLSIINVEQTGAWRIGANTYRGAFGQQTQAHFAIFSKMLTEAEVQEAYNSGTPPNLVNHSANANLEVYYQFNENLSDVSGNGRHGTSEGSPAYSPLNLN